VAHSLSAKKRIRQNETRRMRNRVRISMLKGELKKFLTMLHDRKLDQAEVELKKVCKMLDQTAAKGTIHKNRAARTKGRLTKRYLLVKAHQHA